eukprot:5719613-Amphidinium_carterae.2
MFPTSTARATTTRIRKTRGKRWTVRSTVITTARTDQRKPTQTQGKRNQSSAGSQHSNMEATVRSEKNLLAVAPHQYNCCARCT